MVSISRNREAHSLPLFHHLHIIDGCVSGHIVLFSISILIIPFQIHKFYNYFKLIVDNFSYLLHPQLPGSRPAAAAHASKINGRKPRSLTTQEEGARARCAGPASNAL